MLGSKPAMKPIKFVSPLFNHPELRSNLESQVWKIGTMEKKSGSPVSNLAPRLSQSNKNRCSCFPRPSEEDIKHYEIRDSVTTQARRKSKELWQRTRSKSSSKLEQSATRHSAETKAKTRRDYSSRPNRRLLGDRDSFSIQILDC